MSDEPNNKQHETLPEDSGGDAYIQQIQNERALKIKRTFLILASLLVLAVVISMGLAWQSKTPPSETSFDELKADLETDFSTKEQEAARASFKQALVDFENKLLPTLTNTNISQWREKEVKAIFDEQEKALALFARSGFMQALGTLNEASEAAKALIQAWHQAFENKLEEATALYHEGAVQKARLALAQADKIKPSHPDSDGLKAQLGAFEEVVDYLAQLDVAKVENNIEKQVRLLQQILKADPTRVELQASLDRATKTLNDQRLSLALNEARAALAADDLNKAVTYVQNAQEIRPAASGIKAISEELAKRVANESLSSLHQQISQLSADDAWEQALQTAKRGLANFAQDAKLKQSEAQASQMLSAQQSLQRFLSRPERLADASIREAAKSSLQSAIVLLPNSKKLAAQAQSLAALIDTYSTPVELTILSDEQTHISVIGVGKVGQVERKVIELSPGRYTLEGQREGYRSKRMTIEIEVDTPQSIRLVCDEKMI